MNASAMIHQSASLWHLASRILDVHVWHVHGAPFTLSPKCQRSCPSAQMISSILATCCPNMPAASRTSALLSFACMLGGMSTSRSDTADILARPYSVLNTIYCSTRRFHHERKDAPRQAPEAYKVLATPCDSMVSAVCCECGRGTPRMRSGSPQPRCARPCTHFACAGATPPELAPLRLVWHGHYVVG
jgi:hypothetical protein